MLVFGSVYEFIRGSFSGLPSSLGIQDASAPSYFATTLAVTIFQQRKPWFSDGFFGGRRWSRKDIFLRSCFWGEWNKHTWSHIKGMKVKFRRNKKWMFCQHGYVGGNRETLEIFPPKKKNITPFWWASAGGVSQVRGVCQVFCGARVGEYYAPLDLCHVKALLSYKKVALLSHSQPSNSRNSHGHMISTFV